MKSHKVNMISAFLKVLSEGFTGSMSEGAELLADTAFDTLGITEDEQNAEGGYFMHHAGRKSKEYIVIPLTDEIKNAGSWEEAGHYIWKSIQEGRSDGS